VPRRGRPRAALHPARRAAAGGRALLPRDRRRSARAARAARGRGREDPRHDGDRRATALLLPRPVREPRRADADRGVPLSVGTFRIGGELEVRRLGFGAMRVTRDRDEGIRVLRRAVELGVDLIDTADVYGAGASEELIAEALHPYPEGLVVATKGGITYGPGATRTRDGRPE